MRTPRQRQRSLAPLLRVMTPSLRMLRLSLRLSSSRQMLTPSFRVLPSAPMAATTSRRARTRFLRAPRRCEGGDPVPVDMTTSPAEMRPRAENAGGQSVSPQASDSRAEPAKNDEMILVWRPDHRKTAPRREREARHSRSEARGRSDAQGATPVATPNWRRDTATRPPKRPNRPNSVRADEKRRQRPKDYDMARSTPTTAPQKPAKVDPNSPFAKLLELRSLLEEQANKRQ